jgi:hypothetical protein
MGGRDRIFRIDYRYFIVTKLIQTHRHRSRLLKAFSNTKLPTDYIVEALPSFQNNLLRVLHDGELDDY